MTAAIARQEQTHHGRVFGKAPAGVLHDAVRAPAASPLNRAAVLGSALSALDACVND